MPTSATVPGVGTLPLPDSTAVVQDFANRAEVPPVVVGHSFGDAVADITFRVHRHLMPGSISKAAVDVLSIDLSLSNVFACGASPTLLRSMDWMKRSTTLWSKLPIRRLAKAGRRW
ncbi:hypothetical protein [Streptomyces sp. NBC_00448]|uniref:hypothetical protein n=1 Tax=Streptomyces sp. NBC_00448 TaxID=2903652 RepID=UPI002E222BF9